MTNTTKRKLTPRQTWLLAAVVFGGIGIPVALIANAPKMPPSVGQADSIEAIRARRSQFMAGPPIAQPAAPAPAQTAAPYPVHQELLLLASEMTDGFSTAQQQLANGDVAGSCASVQTIARKYMTSLRLFEDLAPSEQEVVRSKLAGLGESVASSIKACEQMGQ